MKLRSASVGFALLTSGCPQLLEDEFRVGETLVDVDGAPARASAGGASAEVHADAVGGSTGNPPLDASAGGSTPAGVCSVGRQLSPGGDCYVVIPTAMAWGAARTKCQAEGTGWDLAAVRSSADADFIAPLLSAELWIGASDAENEGTWVWVESAVRFWPEDDQTGNGNNDAAYTNWNAGEPNNVDGADCLRLLTTGKWADLRCDATLGSLCSGPATVRR